MDIIIKHVKHVELNTKTERAVSNTPTLEMMQQYINAYVAIRITKKSMIKTLNK